MILKAYRTKAVIRSERGQMGSIFRPPHAECWGEGWRPSHRYCLTDMTVCKGALIKAGHRMGIIITEMEEYCPKVKMEQQEGPCWCYPAKTKCYCLKFAARSASSANLRGTQQLAVSWAGHPQHKLKPPSRTSVTSLLFFFTDVVGSFSYGKTWLNLGSAVHQSC